MNPQCSLAPAVPRGSARGKAGITRAGAPLLRVTTAGAKLIGCVSAVALTTMAGNARADEPRKATEPSVLADSSINLLQIVDSFDDFDDFDIDISLGFEHSARSAPIYRENNIQQPGLSSGGYLSDNLNVATYEETTNRLIPGLDIGVYKDVALKLRLPIILSNTRSLKSLDGSANAGISSPGAAEVPVAFAGLPGERLFSVPFEAPTRSGIEYLAVGLDFGLMNQFRDPSKPTWVFGVEGRFNVSEPMHACNKNPPAGQVACADPSDINRNGEADAQPTFTDADGTHPLEGSFSGSRKAGVSRGTTALEGHTYVSKRIRYIEPYGGVSAMFEFPTGSSDYGETDLEGSLVNHPPLRGSLLVGLGVIPWEVRERFQRISLDFRFKGTYVSEGRDYSELFDALGSSDARSLRNPNFSDYTANVNASGNVDNTEPSVVDTSSQRVYFTGLTDVQQHGEYKLSAQFTWQAGEYVKFDLGGAWEIVQAHNITFDQGCNPDFKGDPTKAGPCKTDVRDGSNDPEAWVANGIPNPSNRRVINDPGRRFRVGTSQGYAAWVRAVVMF